MKAQVTRCLRTLLAAFLACLVLAAPCWAESRVKRAYEEESRQIVELSDELVLNYSIKKKDDFYVVRHRLRNWSKRAAVICHRIEIYAESGTLLGKSDWREHSVDPRGTSVEDVVVSHLKQGTPAVTVLIVRKGPLKRK